MPCNCAVFTTSATMRYFVVASPRMFTSGCGVACAATDNWLSSWSWVTGASFQYSVPSSLTVTVTGGAGGTLSGRWSRLALGSSTLILCVIRGAVIMKMMSRTSITSTRGVTLISDIGAPLWVPVLKAIGRTPSCYVLALGRQFADAGASGEEVVQVMREGVELVVRDPVQADEEVVAEHRRDSREQADGRHDQRLADRTGNRVDRRLAGGADADQGAVDTPDRTQQADERGGRTDRRQHRQAAFQAHRFAGHALAQGAIDELGTVQRFDQARAFVTLVVGRGLGGVERDLGERLVAGLLFHVADRVLRVRGFPERADHAVGATAQGHVLEQIDHNPVQRHRGHDQEGEQHGPLDRKGSWVADHFIEQMVDAHLRQCGGSIASGRSGGVSGFLQHDAYLWSCGLGETMERKFWN